MRNLLERVAAVGSISETGEKKQIDAVVRTFPTVELYHRHAETSAQLASREIFQFIPPIARLLASNGFEINFAARYDFVSPLRDFWFNCVQHGICHGSEIAKQYNSDLQTIAQYSAQLVSGIGEDENLESNLEQMPILRRGMVAQNTLEHKRRLIAMLPANEVDIRTLAHARVIFLEATYTLECLRAEGGGYSKVLGYFVESGFKIGEGSNCMIAVASKVTDIYMRKVLIGNYPQFTAARAAEELADVFVGCCHRLERVQTMATNTADRMVAAIPSALCQRASLFALLELLTLLWISCLDEETDEYTTRSMFTSVKGGVAIELPDSYTFRRKTLNGFKAKAKGWVLKVLNVAPLDVKGLLQTYLSEFEGEDEGSFGHVSLGRSFALEMGSMVPSGDQKLASIEHLGDCEANTASDFVMQYTTRQAYRYTESVLENRQDLLEFRPLGDPANTSAVPARPDSAQAVLDQMESKDYEKEFVPIEEVRDVLKRAAALVCRSEKDQGPLIRGLVGIPFSMFTKKSINLGISLWTGIIHEKPRLQMRLLVEITRNWETTVEKRIGLYSPELVAQDAFDVKMEYSPSDKEQQLIDQHNASELLTPHLKLLHLLSSHYHANRHGNPHIQQIFLRLVRISLTGLHHATGHPLAREIRFRLVLFGLQVLRHSTGLSERQQISLKDLILSAALSWFKFAPKWSFGGNKLQVKAEAHVLQDVANFLNSVAAIGGNKNMRLKQDLLLLLVENEQTRLATWLYPLDHSRKHHLLPTYSARPATDNTIAIVLPAAWQENPAIAVQLLKRFQSPRLEQDVRRLILTFPEKVVDQPDAVQIMMGDKISSNLGFQLKYLLFWAPVNPITAATYFLPSYANNAFVLQYAMRALESHSIDVTFFYVPQIVQTLRYDTLGYVERFILETAKFSQLFAHQIIWNMKANAYKDEDSTIVSIYRDHGIS